MLELWSGDKSVDISANVVTITPREQEQTVMLFDDVRRSGTNIKAQDNLSYFLNETKAINKEQLLVNRPQFYNYRNRCKDTSLQNMLNKILFGFQLDFMIWEDICINESKRFD